VDLTSNSVPYTEYSKTVYYKIEKNTMGLWEFVIGRSFVMSIAFIM
jgi:hypothetical protein